MGSPIFPYACCQSISNEGVLLLICMSAAHAWWGTEGGGRLYLGRLVHGSAWLFGVALHTTLEMVQTWFGVEMRCALCPIYLKYELLYVYRQ